MDDGLRGLLVNRYRRRRGWDVLEQENKDSMPRDDRGRRRFAAEERESDMRCPEKSLHCDHDSWTVWRAVGVLQDYHFLNSAS